MTAAWSVVSFGDRSADIIDLSLELDEVARHSVLIDALPEAVRDRASSRFVWADSARDYAMLLARGIRVAKAWDLRLCHVILRNTSLIPDAAGLGARSRWDDASSVEPLLDTLFDTDEQDRPGIDELLAELRRQLMALDAAAEPARLRLLLHGESAGALIAAEMHAAGLPWDTVVHEGILTAVLGTRVFADATPANMQRLADAARTAIGDTSLNLDSPPKVLRALRRAGVEVTSTSRWELAEHTHPAIEPLLEYKKLARLHTANGWAWLAEWVRGGRFRPVYVPGGVVTGRWASSGGGALQIPRQLRPAVQPDDGWVVIDADVAQLEPRVLAAMSRDLKMAKAARGQDLYNGIVATGAVATRDEAKYAVLGAMYGATTGDSGRLVPRLRRTFPAAMRLVDDAASEGEDGGRVRTWLGRTSPSTDAAWRDLIAEASDADADPTSGANARRISRERGRFTRNFVVQGTAAEWALCWLAEIRARLMALPPKTNALAAASGTTFAGVPHLVFFLHDEVMVHAPAESAELVVAAITDAAAAAGRHLFGDFPIDFPLDVRIIERGSAN